MSTPILRPDPVRSKCEPFAAIPHAACVSDLSDAAYRVLGAVLYFARRGSCDATDRQLGRRCGKSVSAIKRSLRELEEKGWIERRAGARRVIRLRSPGERATPSPEEDPPSEDNRPIHHGPEDAMKEAGDRDWHERYEAYRRTASWQRRRQCVFTRARGTCEVCGVQNAVEVHHLTYERVGQEMLSDLVAVCRACHDKLHPHKI